MTTLTCAGLRAPTTLRRDAFGIAHIDASNEHDAWFGQGFAAAQDRLWQMEYDRRRATGRWSEAAGTAGLSADRMARRLDLARAAKADLEVMAPDGREMFEAYAAGVNGFIASGAELPPEYELTGITPEPWEAWHSLALFKIRHVLMGLWQWKMACGGLLARVGPEAWKTLQFLPAVGSALVLPPGGRISRLYTDAVAEIEACGEHLGFLSEAEPGSNSWVVHGSRTTTGKPVLCNDSHRALDVPNAYWQVHVSCPAFNVAGATFAGFPGFPHFGFNGSVGWNITHTQGDYQDLYVERFDDEGRYLTESGWQQAERRTETICVRGGGEEQLDVWRTRHGPVVHGDPASGTAIALKYTANEGGKAAFDCLRSMLLAGNVEELFDTQRTWVDPVNNLVAADTGGNIGYLVRGELPVRASKAARRLPVPGWTGEHEWVGAVPFEKLPCSINPPEGFVATANQRVIDGDEPYISAYFASPGRANRLAELLGGKELLEPATVVGMQYDRVSTPGRAWAEFLAGQGPFEGEAEAARAMLARWDGDMLPELAEPLLYAYFRRAVMREMFEPIVGADVWAYLTSDANAGLGRIAAGLVAEVVQRLPEGLAPPGGRSWAEVLPAALQRAWSDAVAKAGPSAEGWRWGEHHVTASKHPLTSQFPEARLDPPRAAVGGDADTLQCAGFGISGRNDFVITNLSVYRQVVNFAEPDEASYMIPGGASGDARSTHFADQLPLWAENKRVPMHRLLEQSRAAAATTMELAPAD